MCITVRCTSLLLSSLRGCCVSYLLCMLNELRSLLVCVCVYVLFVLVILFRSRLSCICGLNVSLGRRGSSRIGSVLFCRCVMGCMGLLLVSIYLDVGLRQLVSSWYSAAPFWLDGVASVMCLFGLIERSRFWHSLCLYGQ